MPIENPGKDPSTATPKDLAIYIFHQKTELMKNINTIKTKSKKENYKLKESSKELDLLKHKWQNSPKKGPIKKLHDPVPLCHKLGCLTENITDMNVLKNQMRTFYNDAHQIHKDK